MKQHNKSGNVTMVVLGIVLAAIIGGAVLFVLQSKKDTPTTATNNTTAVTQADACTMLTQGTFESNTERTVGETPNGTAIKGKFKLTFTKASSAESGKVEWVQGDVVGMYDYTCKNGEVTTVITTKSPNVTVNTRFNTEAQQLDWDGETYTFKQN